MWYHGLKIVKFACPLSSENHTCEQNRCAHSKIFILKNLVKKPKNSLGHLAGHWYHLTTLFNVSDLAERPHELLRAISEQ